MKIQGRVIETIKQKKDGAQLIRVKLHTQQTKDLCTVREGKRFCGTSCVECSGCAHSNARGIFAVQGDEVIAKHEQTSSLSIGDIVILDIPQRMQLVQGIRSIGLVVVMGIIGFVLGMFWFGSEGAGIVGLFLGIILAVCFSYILAKIFQDSLLPTVSHLLDEHDSDVL